MMKKSPLISTLAVTAAQTSLIFGHSAAALPVGEVAWDLVRAVDIEEIVTDTTYEVRKSFPSQTANGIDQFRLTGFVTLTETDTNVRNFILVSDMGFCPYCGDPDHGASLQITLANVEPSMIDGDRVTVLGNLTPVYDTETWQAYILQDARVMP